MTLIIKVTMTTTTMTSVNNDQGNENETSISDGHGIMALWLSPSDFSDNDNHSPDGHYNDVYGKNYGQ